MTKAGKRLLDAAREMSAIAKGEAEPFSMHIPPEIDVKAIRRKVSLSQDGFASVFGFTVNQIRDWEQGRTRPIQSDRAYLLLIERHPSAVQQMLSEICTEQSPDELAVAI